MHELFGRPAAFRSCAVFLGVALIAGASVGTLPEAATAVSRIPDETWITNGDVNSVFKASAASTPAIPHGIPVSLQRSGGGVIAAPGIAIPSRP